LSSAAEIEARLQHVVDVKFADVQQQLLNSSSKMHNCCVICADTVVVATDHHQRSIVLGKPPAENWQPTVRSWFTDYYLGRPHEVWTAVRMDTVDRTFRETVKTQIVLTDIDSRTLDWYLTTTEPIGKAGGYAVQGIAAMFVQAIEGSLTNVIGLPMLEVARGFRELGVPCSIS
jgi:septum formation protein